MKTCEILVHGDGRTLPAHFQSEMLEAFQRVAGQFAEIFSEYADARGRRPASSGEGAVIPR